MVDNLHGSNLQEIVEQVLSGGSDEHLFGYPSISLTKAVVKTVGRDQDTTVRILLSEESQRATFDNFVIASHAADLAGEALRIRTVEGTGSSVITGDEQVVAPIGVSNAAGGLIDTDEEFVSEVTAAYEETWEEATDFDIDTPGLTTLVESLESHTTSDLSEAFAEAVDAAETIGERGDSVNIVTLALLLGAREGAQLYDLSEWGEETGLASKATFSRTKSQLEDLELIETESVPIDVGRPRLRLHLTANDLESTPSSEFVETARAVLAE